MNIWKRAWTSILRRKVSSIILLLIIFVLSNVLLTTLTVTTSIQSTKDTVLKQYPPIVNIVYKDDVPEKELFKMSVEKAKQLYDKTRDIVKSFDYSLDYTFQCGDDFNAVALVDTMNGRESNDFLMFEGTQLSATSLVEKEEAKFISGKGFSQTDIHEGNPKIVISKQMAEANALEVGSKMSFQRILKIYSKNEITREVVSRSILNEEHEFEVAGILEIEKVEEYTKMANKNSEEAMQMGWEVDALASTVYIPNNYIYPLIQDDFTRVKQADEQYFKEYKRGQDQAYPTYILSDMNDLKRFSSAANEVYNKKYFNVESVAEEYEILAKPMGSMQNLLDLVFRITIVASVLIVSLVLYVLIYLRQKEMGVYLALGEKRRNIIAQLLIETLIIAMIGATLAIFTSMIFSGVLAENTMQSLLQPTGEWKGATIEFSAKNYGLTPELISQHYDGGFSVVALLVFYGVMITTIVVSQIASVFYLLRLNPKKILM